MLALVLAACGGGSGVVPPGLADRVAGARSSLQDNWEGWLFKPAFDFVGARCRADGGLLLLYALRGMGASGFGFAVQGPGAPGDAWSGGFTQDISTDSEIAFFFAESREIPCEF